MIGKEFVRDEIVYKPAELILRKHYVEVRKCVSCGKDEARDSEYDDIEKAVFVKGKAPVPLLPRSMASPGFLAQIGVEKYGGGKPLYRQEKDYERFGLSISRATMANWIIAAAEGILKPIREAQKRELLRHKVIHADETVVQVLKEDGKTAVSESRMWVYCAGEIGCADNILKQPGSEKHIDHVPEGPRQRLVGKVRGHFLEGARIALQGLEEPGKIGKRACPGQCDDA